MSKTQNYEWLACNIEVDVFKAAKRCGLQWNPWMGDWFVAWSPRNDNSNAEGPWHHWANLAAMILSDERTKEVAPELYRPDLKPDPKMHTRSNPLPPTSLAAMWVKHNGF